MRLIAFGDSWTAGHGVETEVEFKENATPPTFIQKLREQNSWVSWLSRNLNVPFVNMGVCGYGNEYILKSIKDSKKYINKNDIIVVVFSHPFRYERHNKYSPIEVYTEFEKELTGYKRFYFNAFYPLLYENIKFPKHYINPKGTLSYILQVEEIESKKSVWEYGSKLIWNDEENYYEGDYHPNLLGYQILGDFMYSEIKDLL